MRKKLSLTITLFIALSLFSGIASAYGAESTVDIKGMSDTAAIKTAIEAELKNSDTVLVTNSSSEPYSSQEQDLKLLIPTGKKLVWKANYTGDTVDSLPMLFLAGGGTFEQVDCAITNIGEGSVIYQGNGDFVIVGNSKISGNNIALSGNGNIDIQGGTITSKRGVGAVMCYGKFTMSDGIIYAAEGYAVSGEGINSSVTISGGFVMGHFAEDVTAESAHGTAGNQIETVLPMISGSPKIEGTAAVVVWNTMSGKTEYSSGTAEDLTVQPENSAVWWIENGQGGIRYNNSKFFPFDKITVVDALVVQSVNEELAVDSNMNFVITAVVIGGILLALIVLLLLMRRNSIRKRAVVADETDNAFAELPDKADNNLSETSNVADSATIKETEHLEN